MWKDLLKQAVKTKLTCRVLAGFNANVDVVIRLNAEMIENIITENSQILDDAPAQPTKVWPIKTNVEFLALLQECIKVGKSYYGVMDSRLGDWFNQAFTGREEAMGGQAGIIANQMAALGATSCVYCPVLSPKQAAMFDERVLYPKVNGKVSWIPIRTAVNDQWTKLNYIFEYAKGIRFKFGNQEIVSPRANRVILGTRNPKAAMGFDPAIQPVLAEVGQSVDLAFMAGYHHGRIEGRAETLAEYIELSVNDLKRLKSGNPDLKLHLEYVPMPNAADEVVLLREITPLFTSFGINENEIRRLLDELGYPDLVAEIVKKERAFSLYQGVLQIARELKVSRIQLHNLGYYVVVLMKPYAVDPAVVRQACLFASAVNGVKALQGGAVPLEDVTRIADYPLSEIGLGQLRAFVSEAKSLGLPAADEMIDTGIMEMDDHWVLIVPAHVIPNPVSTVGMGDTVSSSAYAAEVSLAAVKSCNC
ncbi:MAG TPA: ADP-dependent glucokinase/phosphofructokinase [Limnochordia bacterium]|jgi:ADP-dependent phosphofructokinase/glucokinase|nr:ADP-dependent glucokinase/phosphofructokinase [Limnochordia bacterium]